MVRLGMEVRYQTDYILGMYHILFRNVPVWEPRHNSDYYMILGCLHSATLREHKKYLGRRTRIPLWHPTTPTSVERLVAALWRAIPKQKTREAQKNAWISVDMWRLVNTRVSALRYPARDQAFIW